MQKFRTEIFPAKPGFNIEHKHQIVSIGSCFSENIGKKFHQYKFNICINPFGQQYNPYSIAQSIQRLIDGLPYSENELVYHNELYHSFDHHGNFSAATIEDTLKGINERLKTDSLAIKNADVLFITFGTSHYFSLLDNGKIVSNCHKLSGSKFNRHLLSPDEITSFMSASLQNLRAQNPKVKLIFTVSPVRYFAFGEYENSVSKGHLFTAVHQLLRSIENSYYFPAYELVIDDLRDYRFFAEDLLHPNYAATGYVWQKISETYFNAATLNLMMVIDKIVSAASHRPRNPQSASHHKFVQNQLQLIHEIKSTHNLDFHQEEELLKKSLETAG